MNVAFVTSSYPAYAGDPAGHFVQAEATAEASRGSRVTVLAPGTAEPGPRDANPRLLRLPDLGLFGWPGALPRLMRHPHRLAGVWSFVRSARAALDELGPFDRVVAHWIVPCGWPIAIDCGAPLEIVAHGSDVRLLAQLPRAAVDRMLLGLIRRRARIRFVSHQLRDQLCAGSRAWLQSHSWVEPCPVDLSGIPSRTDARIELGLSQSEAVILMVSRLLRSKRVAVGLEAASLVAQARVVVVGDGPERPALGRRFPAVTWLGQCTRPETLRWIVAADVLVTASRREGASTVVREAVALGTPVVATPNGDLTALDKSRSLVTVIAAPPGR